MYVEKCADIASNNTKTRHVIQGKTFNHNSFSIISLDGLLVYYQFKWITCELLGNIVEL